MPITPTGAPAWVKSNDHTTYGGNVDKTNYQSQGAVNPLTDVTAAQFCRMASDLAAVVRTASLATITYDCDDVTPGPPVMGDIDSPVATPTTARLGDGVVSFTWAASYSDEYSVSGAVHIAHAHAQLHAAIAGSCSVLIMDVDGDGLDEYVRVYAFDAAGAALSNARVTLTVYTGAI